MTRTTQDLLRSLRWRLTITFATVALLGLAVLSLALVLLDTSFEGRHLVSELRGQAARAAALVYISDKQVQVEAVQDDAVRSWAYGLAILQLDITGRQKTLFTSGRVDPASLTSVGRGALTDIQDHGTVQVVKMGDDELQAVSMPWYSGDTPMGAAVAVAPVPRPQASRLLLPVAGGGLGLLALLTLTVWFIAGRSLRPAGRALADRERFLATSAHELRSPLARLRAGAEAARRSAPANDPAGLALRRLVTVADSAGRVVSNILLASRIDHAEVPVQRNRVRLDQVACDIEHLHDDLVVDVSEPVTIIGDVGLLRHAVTNLVDNAVRHGRVGEDAPTVIVTVAKRDGYAVVCVSDDGPGFPMGVDVLARYVSGPRGGTGLGLPLVQWIVERHGGTMRLGGGTAHDPGASIELAFPLAPDADDESVDNP